MKGKQISSLSSTLELDNLNQELQGRFLWHCLEPSGGANVFPDFAFHPDILVNADGLCYVVNTSTTKARKVEINRIQRLAENTKHKLQHLHHPDAFGDIVTKLHNYIRIHEE